tara:strand:- start:424 stop:858 length:435 start_codon:yes stop_codon:yes gene_type:complete
MSDITSGSQERFNGRVKWFNNKAGYGFVTVTNGHHLDKDIFVHHSAINVSNEQYKYLVQGEYVNLDLSKMESGEHEFQAVNVKGIDNGKLMCETRNETRANLVNSPHKTTPARRGPRENLSNSTEQKDGSWVFVEKKGKTISQE